jgi:capsular exopolysaccharide synthesis family protein
MSRVFDALKKASQEKATVVASATEISAEMFPSSPEPVVMPKANGNGNGNGNGTNGKHAIAGLLDGFWREKSEEILFGRDLRNYDNYPIPALQKGSPAAEHYKMLREQVRGLRSPNGAYFLSITSPIKRDGKSSVAVNLGAAIALETDEKVLLMDCDFRRPQLHNYFSLRRTPGISDYLTSTSDGNILSYIQETSVPGLQLLSAGTPTSLSSELLATEKMNGLMKEIRLKLPHHRIIVDTPPVLSTSDARVLARLVDGIIMIIRAGKTPRDCVTEAMQILQSDKLVGIVLNGAELGIESNYYNY